MPLLFRPLRSLALADDAYEFDDPSEGEEHNEVRNGIVWSTRDPSSTFNLLNRSFGKRSFVYLEFDLNNAGETFSSDVLNRWTLKAIPVTVVLITTEKFTLEEKRNIRSFSSRWVNRSTDFSHIFFVLFLLDEHVIDAIFFMLALFSSGVQNSEQTSESSINEECDDLPVAEKFAEFFDQSMSQFSSTATIGSGENQHRIRRFDIR